MMGSFGPLAASLGFFLRGQQQGEQAQSLEALKAQILRRQAIASTRQLIQQPDGTYKLVDLADPNLAGTIGTPIDYTARLKAMHEAAPDYLKPIIQKAIDSPDRDFQQQVATGALTEIEKPPKALTSGRFPSNAAAQALAGMGLDPDTTYQAAKGGDANAQAAIRRAQQMVQQNALALARGRADIITSVQDTRPFSSIIKDSVPYVSIPIKDATGTTIGTRDQALSTTAPFGTYRNRSDVFYVPKNLVTNGTYARLDSLPQQGQQLAAFAAKLLGETPGGLPAGAKRTFAQIQSTPEYAQLQTQLATYVDTIASSFSRRVSQQLIDNWRAAIAPRTGSAASIRAAVAATTKAAQEQQQRYREQGLGNVNAEYSGVINPLLGAAGVESAAPEPEESESSTEGLPEDAEDAGP